MIYEVEVNENGHFWRYNGKPHRDGDKPAAIYADGTVFYYLNGKLHREGDKPAVIWADGSEYYYKNGIRYTPPLPRQDNIVEISTDTNTNW